jgi:DNA-binding MarR family transcriptional regulator
MSTTSSDRAPMIGALMRVAVQAMTAKYVRWLETSGFDHIQPAHAAAIQPLWEIAEGARITTLARAARITKQSMSALVDHLETHGYVERVADPDDARATRVRLTARGRAFARAARAFGRELELELAGHIGARRLEELRATLELLRTTAFAGEV